MKTIIGVCVSLLLLIGCGSAYEEKEYMSSENSASYSDSITEYSNGFVSSSAAAVSKDTSRKFIRTADLKFRVKDVFKATLSLEDIAASYGGFVTYTHLNSSIDRKDVTPISADSSLESIFYTVKNELIIRVPNTKLDSAIRTMAIHIDYLDYRTIKAQDVTLSLVSNKLTQKRIEDHSERITDAIDNRGKKLKETSNAEENLLNKKELADKAKLSSLSIQDQIDYSTINLNIYQRQSVKRSVMENFKNIDAYQPSFFSQVWESIKTGWDVLKNIVVVLFGIWPLFLFAFLGWVVYKSFFKNS